MAVGVGGTKVGVCVIVEVADGIRMGEAPFTITVFVYVGLTDVEAGDEMQPPNPYNPINPVRITDNLRKFDFIVLSSDLSVEYPVSHIRGHDVISS